MFFITSSDFFNQVFSCILVFYAWMLRFTCLGFIYQHHWGIWRCSSTRFRNFSFAFLGSVWAPDLNAHSHCEVTPIVHNQNFSFVFDSLDRHKCFSLFHPHKEQFMEFQLAFFMANPYEKSLLVSLYFFALQLIRLLIFHSMALSSFFYFCHIFPSPPFYLWTSYFDNASWIGLCDYKTER